MTLQIQSDIQFIIYELKKYSPQSAELANEHLQLLKNTGAGPETYKYFHEDIKGALEVFQ